MLAMAPSATGSFFKSIFFRRSRVFRAARRPSDEGISHSRGHRTRRISRCTSSPSHSGNRSFVSLRMMISFLSMSLLKFRSTSKSSVSNSACCCNGNQYTTSLTAGIKVLRAVYQYITSQCNFSIEFLYHVVKTIQYRRHTHDISPEARYFVSAYSVSTHMYHIRWKE